MPCGESAVSAAIVSRKDWGAKPPKGTRQKMVMPAAGTWIHHTVTSGQPRTKTQEKAHMRELQQIAFSRGFSDISYNFVIFESGRVYKGRGWGIVGAHTEGSNSIAHAFCFVGNYETQKPTPASLESAGQLHRQGIKAGHIRKGGFIKGHREAPGAATACPGKNLFAKLDVIRKEAA